MIRDTVFVGAALSVPILVLLGMTSASEAKERPHKVSGEVTAVSMPDQTLTVKRKGATELKLLVGSGSEILSGKEKKSLSDVHVGDKVKGKYTDKDGQHVARTLYVSSVPGSEKKSGAVSSTESKPPLNAPAPPAAQPVTPGK